MRPKRILLYVVVFAAACHKPARREPVPRPPDATPARPQRIVTELLPFTIDPTATLAGWIYASGTLEATFVEPSGEHLSCRSRDRGASIRCRRSGPDAGAGVPAGDAGSPTAVASVRGELLEVSVGTGGALRVRHGTALSSAPFRPLAISARAVWLVPAGDRVVLFASGDVTTVLYTDDRGETWRSAREAP